MSIPLPPSSAASGCKAGPWRGSQHKWCLRVLNELTLEFPVGGGAPAIHPWSWPLLSTHGGDFCEQKGGRSLPQSLQSPLPDPCLGLLSSACRSTVEDVGFIYKILNCWRFVYLRDISLLVCICHSCSGWRYVAGVLSVCRGKEGPALLLWIHSPIPCQK